MNTFVFLTPGEIELIHARLTIIEKGNIAMQAAMERIIREVSEQRTVTSSVITFITGLKDQIAVIQAELAAMGSNSAALQSLSDDLDSQQQQLADAITTNTQEPPPAT